MPICTFCNAPVAKRRIPYNKSPSRDGSRAFSLARTGAMAPAEALDPETFLNAVSGELFRWRRLNDRDEV